MKPMHIDGLLYYLLQVSGAIQTAFTQADVRAVIPEPWLTYLVLFNGTFILAGLTALKSFRSTAYADHKVAEVAKEGDSKI